MRVRVQRTAARMICRAGPQQVPSAGALRPTWAGPWMWLVLCVAPPAISAAACAAQHRLSESTWGTMLRTTHLCLSCWAWAYRCCWFCRRYCCRCTGSLCRKDLPLCSLCGCGCRRTSATGTFSPDVPLLICSCAQAPFCLPAFCGDAVSLFNLSLWPTLASVKYTFFF